MYPLDQTTLDLGRVDALFCCLVLAGLYLAYAETRKARQHWLMFAASGVVISLAGWTKAPIAAAPVALAIVIYLVVASPRSSLPFLLCSIACVAAIVLALRLQSGPWPTWYLWDLTRMHEVRQNLIGRFWFTDPLPRMSLPLLAGPVFALASATRGERLHCCSMCRRR